MILAPNITNKSKKSRIKKIVKVDSPIVNNIHGEARVCPTCENQLIFNGCTHLEIEESYDEYFKCKTCDKDWVCMWIANVITSKMDETERRVTLT